MKNNTPRCLVYFSSFIKKKVITTSWQQWRIDRYCIVVALSSVVDRLSVQVSSSSQGETLIIVTQESAILFAKEFTEMQAKVSFRSLTRRETDGSAAAGFLAG